ncbi:MAG: substrate-binding domain-containing protein [Oscillospiraceae bacterium]
MTVVSREDGSGTRGAFIELFEILIKGENGSKVDQTTKEAVIANKTDIMLTNVSGDDYAIGYVSLGSLNDSVKALKIDGIEATAANVKNNEYKVARPFVIATKGEATGLKKDFIDFVLSKEGQEVVAKSYISVSDDAKPYAGDKPAGKLVIAGSSSVTPIMEKLKEAYIAINPSAAIQIQQSDSTAGMTGTIEGTCDIGMASRDMKDSEKEQLTGTSIAIDGIAVIVNPNNTVSEMTTEQVNKIFTGKSTTWDAK